MADERVNRRLAAILAADVVGYSRLIEFDEAGTRARFRSLQLELIEPRIAADEGRIVKTMGDGFLIEFPSVVDAVHCALAIQTLMQMRNVGIPEDIKMELRIGVNTGDVIVEGDDIHGDGVNVAARLEGICEPGAVFVSGAVYDQAAGKLEASFEDLGERTVKNLAKPVRVYRAVAESSLDTRPRAPTSDTRLPREERPSIAVLPFDNLSNDPEQEYFSDGMAEDLITDISKISGVSVTARNSSFAFKGQSSDAKEIAKQLGVGHIVEGSVRKMGDRLRINAQLINGADGRHIWAERYDGNLAEIFDFQDDIREQIVSALKVSLSPSDKELSERKLTNSVEAYDLFLKGRAHFHLYELEHTLEAIKCWEKAIELDPNFADAYGYLSYCHFRGWVQHLPGFDDTLDRANDLAERAVALDGMSAFALARLGFVQSWARRYDQAVSNLEKAIALAPNDAEVYATFGQVLNYWGEPERGLEMLEKALSLDTLAPPIWEHQLGHSHLLLRQYDKALFNFQRALERAPKHTPAYLHLACTYAELDRVEDAHDTVASLLELVPNYTLKAAERNFTYRIEADQNRLLCALRKAGLPEG
jgi:TolB-like protein